jgi:hypothetical protein
VLATAARDGVIHLACRPGEPAGAAAATDHQVIGTLGYALAGSGAPVPSEAFPAGKRAMAIGLWGVDDQPRALRELRRNRPEEDLLLPVPRDSRWSW